MKFLAKIDIMPHKELLDPQGKTVEHNLPNIGIQTISNVRIGKCIELEIEAPDQAAAKLEVENACKKLLVNAIMEHYEYELSEI